jgi:DDE superfamily endonuclease
MIVLEEMSFLSYGLKKAGFKWNRMSVSDATKKDLNRFHSCYGVGPKACKDVWEDLQTIANDEVSISDPKLKYFFLALAWLEQYQTNTVMAGNWKVDEDTVRKYAWKYTHALQVLMREKVQWVIADPNNPPEQIFLASVDGTHCRISEIRQSPDKKWCSYKFKKAGVVYEIGLGIWDGKLCWVNGPFPAGETDLVVFRKPDGLLSKVPDGYRLVADAAYRGEAKIVSGRNPLDTPEVIEMKKRTKARHEVFNKHLKDFRILSERFRCATRHRLELHKAVFEACCLLVHYELKYHPLFEI